MPRCIVNKNDIINNRYCVIEKLGKGAYGDVFKCKDTLRNLDCAIKFNKNDYKYHDSSRIEIKILLELNEIIDKNNYKNYVPELLEYFVYNNHYCISLRLYDINLYEFLMKNYYNEKYNSDFVLRLSYKIIKGMYFINKNKIIHCDLKPENILFNKELDEIVICDFGLSDYNDHNGLLKYKYDKQSIWYRAPEISLKHYYNYKIDIWSIGTILYEILFNKPLFPCKTDNKLINKISILIGNPDKSISKYKNFDKFFTIGTFGKIKLRNIEYINNSITSIDGDLLEKKFNNQVTNTIINIIKKILVWNMDDRIDYDEILKSFK